MGFLQDLTGATARKQLKRSKAASDAALQAGYDEAQPFYEEAFDLYEPYATSGQEANTRYNQLLGLGTEEERAAAQDTYLSDPIFSSVLDQQSNALLRQRNARGGTYTGATTMAAGRLGLENYGNYLNRLQGQGQQGFQATGARSNVRLGQGDLRYGFGATKAGQEINYGNARAAASQAGVNNLLSLGGLAIKGAGLIPGISDIRAKRDIEEIGALPSGLPLYSFRYLWDNAPQVGVMAHEAAEIFPEAVFMHDSGYLAVDYDRIG